MKIIVDAFGGDNAPLEILRGCELALKTPGIEILLAGDEELIKACAAEYGVNISNMEIIPAHGVIGMDEEPTAILKEKKECSMAAGFRALAEKRGDAFVTAGSTGAMVVGATFLVKRIKGIKRPVLAAVLPTKGEYCVLVDTGANVECRAEMLMQFGQMGAAYAENAVGYKSPRVGLLNVGTEDTKGGALQQEAFALLKNSELNFIGNVEARSVPEGACNVLVCDGFSGNIVLKLTEGVASFMMGMVKAAFKRSPISKLAYLLVKPGVNEMKQKMDYQEYAGAPLLGVTAPVIKSHGNSSAKVMAAAICQADRFAKSGVCERIGEAVSN